MKRENALLILIVIFGCFITYYPHIDYPYPLHVDEWNHITFAKDIAKNNEIPLVDPFTKKFEVESNLEIGYHLLLGELVTATDIDIIYLKFIPVFFFIVSALCVYIFARRFGTGVGLLSVLFLSLIPTNVTILGPKFFVPVNLGFIFIPLGLFLAYRLIENNNSNNFMYYFSIFVISLFMLLAHPPTALALFLILFVFGVLNFKEHRRKVSLLMLAILIAIFLSIPHFYQKIIEWGSSAALWSSRPYLQDIFELPKLFGYIQTILFIIGFYFLVLSGKRKNLILPFSIIILLIDLFIYANYEWILFFPFGRIYMYLMLLMSIIAAYGLIKIKDISFDFSKSKRISYSIMILILIIVVFMSFQQHTKTPYYYILEGNDYENFLWLKENTGEDAVVLADPWKAKALIPVSGRKTVSIIGLGPSKNYDPLNKEIFDFFNNKCSNTDFLVANNVTIIYSSVPYPPFDVECENNKLVEIRDKIYKYEHENQN